MFNEMRYAINAAENVVSQLAWRKNSVTTELDTYNEKIASGDELTDWEQSEKSQLATELDLIMDIEKYITKWVKSQF